MNRPVAALALAIGLAGLAAPQALAQTAVARVVMLELAGGAPGICQNGYVFSRSGASGNSLGSFVIPAGNVFLITDIDWQYNAPTGAAEAGQQQTLRLSAVPKTGGGFGVIVLESTITLSSAGQGGTSATVHTPAAINSNATICTDITPGPFSGGGGVQSVIIRGVLQAGWMP